MKNPLKIHEKFILKNSKKGKKIQEKFLKEIKKPEKIKNSQNFQKFPKFPQSTRIKTQEKKIILSTSHTSIISNFYLLFVVTKISRTYVYHYCCFWLLTYKRFWRDDSWYKIIRNRHYSKITTKIKFEKKVNWIERKKIRSANRKWNWETDKKRS